jgi:hypothetical protein
MPLNSYVLLFSEGAYEDVAKDQNIYQNYAGTESRPEETYANVQHAAQVSLPYACVGRKIPY